ncbi:MAG TPA: putative colanic acid biosynthesis acetyltransferase [Planctomycetota bacterium]|nr:putative colanic acid biosynthesis acetyltransferase [Planctomycetota bacterium]
MTEQPQFNYSAGNMQWSLRMKIRRGFWNLACLVLFRPSPKRLGNRWRLFLLRRFGATINGQPLILPSVRILQPWLLTMGEGGAIGDDAEIYNYDRVTIGAHTVISQQACLCTGSHDYRDPSFPLTWKPITVGTGCWLAARAFVLPGVTIADGTVVGACSLVTKDLPPWSVCSGNPCVVIRPRTLKDGSHGA